MLSKDKRSSQATNRAHVPIARQNNRLFCVSHIPPRKARKVHVLSHGRAFRDGIMMQQ